jgi:fructose-1,6-bisphosphatase II
VNINYIYGMDRNLALEFVRVTEAGAIAAAEWIGKGDKCSADGAAVSEIRSRFAGIDVDGIVVIGEGEKDEAPELYVGESVGTGTGPQIDIAVDPLECTNSVAYGYPNAISVIATGPRGSLFSAPDMHMDKIAVGPGACGCISFTMSVAQNIAAVSEAIQKPISAMTVAVLDRPRHEVLVSQIRATGARVRLFSDGDVAFAIACSQEESGIDMLLGIGGSTEGVLAAAAIKCLGGELLTRLMPKNDIERERLERIGVLDVARIYTQDELAIGDDVSFTATGIIDGPLLKGVRETTTHHITHSVVMRCRSKTVRFIETYHLK